MLTQITEGLWIDLNEIIFLRLEEEACVISMKDGKNDFLSCEEGKKIIFALESREHFAVPY